VLDLLKLKTFRVAAATNNFTRAAAELGYCQSTVTTHIQALERELGAPLFDRVGRSVLLTEVGRRTLEYANRIMALADEAKDAVQTLYPHTQFDFPSPLDSQRPIEEALDKTRDPAVIVDERVRSDDLTPSCLGRGESGSVRAPDLAFSTAVETTSIQVINLFLLVDHDMFREGLVTVLEKEPGFKVVGQCGSPAAALATLNESGATMMLLDIDPHHGRALDFVLKCKEKGFKGQVLVVTAGASGQEAVQLVRAGVVGILYKHHSTEELCNTIRQVAAGEVYLEQKCFQMLEQSVDPSGARNRPLLTEQDTIVLRFISQGLSNRDISVRLQISESGVKSSLRQLFDKLRVRTRAQLVKIALEQYRDQL
jgi:two-component system nitrate/nitrite response regulator NarL